jgi:hypothetical protein
MTTTIVEPAGPALSTSVLSGTVISAGQHTEYSTVREADVQLGNGRVQPGQVYTEAQNVADVWLRLDTGKEMKLPFQPLGLAMREGHAVSFVFGLDKTKPRCIGARNFTTDEVKTSEVNAIKVAASELAQTPSKLSFKQLLTISGLSVLGALWAEWVGDHMPVMSFLMGLVGTWIGLWVLIKMHEEAELKKRAEQMGSQEVASVTARLQGLATISDRLRAAY